MPGDPTTAATPTEQLRAGPISLEFEDGELRYLRVGQKEIVRRIYFAVRDGQWNTAMPRFTTCQINKGDDHFTIKLAAVCKLDAVDYHWTGTVTGSADGKITFQAAGDAQADFASNRIGLCVLYGAPSLKGQAFDAVGEKNAVTKGQFPLLVLNKLVAERFNTLRYTTAEGLSVSCSVAGATFDMEDQRNWGDSSYKAYAPLRYTYPKIKKGEKKDQTVTLSVAGTTTAGPNDEGPIHLKLTDRVIGKIPKFVPSAQFRNAVGFPEISFNRDRYKGAKVVIWSYIPTEHLPDNDTVMENVPTICTQARTILDFAPEASLRVGISLRAAKKPGRDPRAGHPFGAAWETAMLKYVSCANVEETAFDLGPGYAPVVLDAIRPDAGKEILQVEAQPRPPLFPTAFAIKEDESTSVWVANRTGRAVPIVIEGLGDASRASLMQIDAQAKPDTRPADQEAEIKDGRLSLELAPYGVCRVMLQK